MYELENNCINFLYSFLDAIFCENTEPRSLQDKQKGAKQTFEEMMNYIPGMNNSISYRSVPSEAGV